MFRMPDTPGSSAEVSVRPALPGDHGAFVSLFPELQVDDPVPGADVWTKKYVPSTSVAVRSDEVLGYCYFEELDDTGYVRHIVVAPNTRRRGTGTALMTATAQRLRANGRTAWCLNVKADNVAAIALYSRLGMQVRYSTKALRLPWASTGTMRPSRRRATGKLVGRHGRQYQGRVSAHARNALSARPALMSALRWNAVSGCSSVDGCSAAALHSARTHGAPRRRVYAAVAVSAAEARERHAVRGG
jgi:GNAT superfamily N-acetyltransferase